MRQGENAIQKNNMCLKMGVVTNGKEVECDIMSWDNSLEKNNSSVKELREKEREWLK